MFIFWGFLLNLTETIIYVSPKFLTFFLYNVKEINLSLYLFIAEVLGERTKISKGRENHCHVKKSTYYIM